MDLTVVLTDMSEGSIHEKQSFPRQTGGAISRAQHLAGQLRCAALDVHFARPAPVLPPGSATLQRGFWSRAGARCSQGKPWSTGSRLLKRTSRCPFHKFI